MRLSAVASYGLFFAKVSVWSFTSGCLFKSCTVRNKVFVTFVDGFPPEIMSLFSRVTKPIMESDLSSTLGRPGRWSPERLGRDAELGSCRRLGAIEGSELSEDDRPSGRFCKATLPTLMLLSVLSKSLMNNVMKASGVSI